MTQFDFANHDTLYASHGLHAFAAKCPPQLVRYALQQYSEPGDLLLDPMVGSGTALVEARLMGRNGLGFDIDPLARLIAHTKCQVVHDADIEVAQQLVSQRAAQDCEMARLDQVTPTLRERLSPPDFPNRDYWFDREVSLALSALAYHIGDVAMPADVRNLLWVAFSSVILARTSVANARDIIHSRHHYFRHPKRPDPLRRFGERVRRMRKQVADFRDRCQAVGQTTWAKAQLGDSRSLDLDDETVDLVFSSPPYATALDYPRAHFLAIPWMKAALGIDLATYMAHAPRYIGSERGRLGGPLVVDSRLARLDQTPSVLAELATISERHAKLCHRYFVDMYATLSEVARVLKNGRHAIIVVCPSHIRRVDVPTHRVLVEIGQAVGLVLRYQHTRTISERRRVMPYVSAFGSRMSTEYILVFQKAWG